MNPHILTNSEKKGYHTMITPVIRAFVPSGVFTVTTSLAILTVSSVSHAAEEGPASVDTVVQANSAFAFDLYQQLAKENEGDNLFFSPYSVSGALAMTAEGARGETASEMGKVLRFPDAAKRAGAAAQMIPWDTSLIHRGMATINQQLMGEDPVARAENRAKIVELRKALKAVKANMNQLERDKKWEEWRAEHEKERDAVAKLNAELAQVDQHEIRVANALWGEQTYPFDPNYIRMINKHYDTGGGLFPVDFKSNFEAERRKINGWVEDQTNNRIKDLLPKGSLNDSTRLVLTNAIYFKGDWATPFKKANTKDRDFTLASGETLQTDIMHAPGLAVARYGAFNADGSHFDTPARISRDQDPKGHYPQADGFAMVELPYKGDELSMIVIAPNDPASLPTIETQLTPENLNQWIGKLQKRDTHVTLPKFKMEAKYTLGDAEGTGALQSMGMARAFKDPRDPKTGAQFQGMTTSTDPMEQLYISKVFHKAFLEVNEKGTEAAAATAVVMGEAFAGPMDYPFTPEFKADRPFVFLIRDNQSGSVLFLGRMTQPNS